MSVKYAILGILSCNPMNGYDLKKIIQDSPFMHWAGNNNQIYTSLLELLNDGFVTHEIRHQESSPSKKIYTITEEGIKALKSWVLSMPEYPEFKKTFLVQLAWADQLSISELKTMLSQYEFEIKMKIIMLQDICKRGAFSPGRSARENYIWDKIYQNIISVYENELEWVRDLRDDLCSQIVDTGTIKYSVAERSDKKYIVCDSVEAPIGNEQDALELIGGCVENDTSLLLIQMEALSNDFLNLKTGLSMRIMQLFANYHIKVAVVNTDHRKTNGKLKELQAESNIGSRFRILKSKEEAENWLLNS